MIYPVVLGRGNNAQPSAFRNSRGGYRRDVDNPKRIDKCSFHTGLSVFKQPRGHFGSRAPV